MGMGDFFKKAWSQASDAGRQAAAGIATGAEWVGKKGLETIDWTAEQAAKAKREAEKAAEWAKRKADEAAKWTKQTADEASQWAKRKAIETAEDVEAGIDWAVDKAKQGAAWSKEQANKAADWAIQKGEEAAAWAKEKARQAKALAKAAIDWAAEMTRKVGRFLAAAGKMIIEGVKELLRTVLDGLAGIALLFVRELLATNPCLFGLLSLAAYAALPASEMKKKDGDQYLVCSKPGGSKPGEQVIYRVTPAPGEPGMLLKTAKIDPNDFMNEDKTIKIEETIPETAKGAKVAYPTLNFVNGIQNTPADSLSSAMETQRNSGCIHGKGEPESCVLNTYSAMEGGMLRDVAHAGMAKFLGASGSAAGESLKNQIKAAASGGKAPITIVAHSRGSIITNNAWNEAFDELVAEEEAREEAAIRGGEGSFWDKQARLAGLRFRCMERVSKRMESITVITAGNAAYNWMPGANVVNLVNFGRAGDREGSFISSDKVAMTLGTLRAIPVHKDEDGMMNHNYNLVYAEDVGKQICPAQKAP